MHLDACPCRTHSPSTPWLPRGVVGVVVGLVVALLAISPAHAAEVSFPPRIAQREFVLDEAQLLTQQDKAAIVRRCDETLTATGVPIVVVTIPSLANYHARGWSIERYALELYNTWQIGSMVDNAGVLLLVSKDDRKLRIELGKGYNAQLDAKAQQIMTGVIVPAFRRQDFAGGLTQGVDALAAMVTQAGNVRPTTAGGGIADAPSRQTSPTPTPTPMPALAPASGRGPGAIGWTSLPVISLIVIFIIARSLFRGSRPVSPYGMGGMAPWMMHRSMGRGGGFGGGGFGGGSFGGGSFGGGRGGGGGASGGW